MNHTIRRKIRRFYENNDPPCPNCGDDNCLPIHDEVDVEGGWYCPNCKNQF